MARGKAGGSPGKRPTKKLRVIPEPVEGTRSVLIPDEGMQGPPIRGAGGPKGVDYTCGDCDRVLIENFGHRQRVVNVVIRCSCGAYNDTGGAPELN